MKQLIVRHGECEANVKKIVAGARDDSPLTVNGIEEAVKTAEKLTDFHGIIMSSPLQRALKTAEIIRDIVAPDQQIQVEPLFSERDVGDATGKPLDEYFALEKAGAVIANAETDQMMFTRVQRGIEKLRALNADVLLVMHNGTYRMIECVVRNLPPHQFANIASISNAEVKTLEI